MRFLLLDRVTELEVGARIAGWKNVAMSEDYLEWHFPERPILPGVLILESFVQLAGWLEAEGSDFERWFLLDRVSSARYYAFAVPGDRVTLTLTVEPSDDPDRRCFTGESTIEGQRNAVVAFEGRTVPLGDLGDPEAARRALAALRRDAS